MKIMLRFKDTLVWIWNVKHVRKKMVPVVWLGRKKNLSARRKNAFHVAFLWDILAMRPIPANIDAIIVVNCDLGDETLKVNLHYRKWIWERRLWSARGTVEPLKDPLIPPHTHTQNAEHNKKGLISTFSKQLHFTKGNSCVWHGWQQRPLS